MPGRCTSSLYTYTYHGVGECSLIGVLLRGALGRGLLDRCACRLLAMEKPLGPIAIVAIETGQGCFGNQLVDAFERGEHVVEGVKLNRYLAGDVFGLRNVLS